MTSNLSILIPAIILGAIGGFIIAYFLIALAKNFWGDPRTIRIRWVMRQKEGLLKQSDDLLKTGQLIKTLDLLGRAPCFEGPASDKFFVEKFHDHNLSVLSRLIGIAQKHGILIPNLAVIEELFQSRTELLFEYMESEKLKNQLRDRERTQGKKTPDWAFSECAKKLSNIEDNLLTNTRSLKSQFDEIFALLRKAPEGEGIVYH